MERTCIALVDASRARLLTFERTSDPSATREELFEYMDLVNPARRRRPSELFSDTRPGTNRTGRLQYTFDDHREAHVAHIDAEFARGVRGAIDRLVTAQPARRLIVCASPRMLGLLRAAELRHDGIVVDELPRDLVRLPIAQVRARLASYGLLPGLPARHAQAQGH